MLRLSILQSVNGAVLRLNINENRFLTTCMNNLNTRNGTVETKDTSKLQDTTDSDIDGNVYNQINNKRAVLKKQERDSMLSKKNKPVSIFGSKTVKNYRIQYIEDNNDLKIPYVTHVLSETMSPKVKTALERWKKNIIDIYGEEYFKTYCEDLLKNGKLFNSYIQMMFLKKIVDIPSSFKPIHSSIELILRDLHIPHKIQTNVELIHPILRYKSIINFIASYRGHTYLVEWKKSRERKTSLAVTYDAPIQVAAYIGAVNAADKYTVKINKGLIIVAYTSGEPASVHELKGDALQIAWREWLNRLEQFYANYNKDSLNT